MAVTGFTWFQGESNECPTDRPGRWLNDTFVPAIPNGGPCGGEYYACQINAMLSDWRAVFKQPAVPFLVNELGALADHNWPVMRQSFHQGLSTLQHAAVVANADMGVAGKVFGVPPGLPSGAMHSPRKQELGRRNALAMLALAHPKVTLPGTGSSSGPVLASASIVAAAAAAVIPTASGLHVRGAVKVTATFDPATAKGLHWHGTAECTVCCTPNANYREFSALELRVVNDSDITGFSWQRTAMPTIAGNTVSAVLSPEPAGALVSTELLRMMYDGFPQCGLYEGVGGPDNDTAISASPFFVNISTTPPRIVPAPACAVTLKNGGCYQMTPPLPPKYACVPYAKGKRCVASPCLTSPQCESYTSCQATCK